MFLPRITNPKSAAALHQQPQRLLKARVCSPAAACLSPPSWRARLALAHCTWAGICTRSRNWLGLRPPHTRTCGRPWMLMMRRRNVMALCMRFFALMIKCLVLFMHHGQKLMIKKRVFFMMHWKTQLRLWYHQHQKQLGLLCFCPLQQGHCLQSPSVLLSSILCVVIMLLKEMWLSYANY